jgi:hypothetical protein
MINHSRFILGSSRDGGIGRHAGLRSLCLISVRVQVPLPAPGLGWTQLKIRASTQGAQQECPASALHPLASGNPEDVIAPGSVPDK